jgi:hypothetical protein
LAASVAVDVGVWIVLRDPKRFVFKTRLALDSADIALWSLAPYAGDTPYALAIFVGFPLALEAGLRRGWFGLVVPAVAMASTFAVRSLVGRPANLQFFTWLFVGVGCGLLLRRYIARLQEQAEDEWLRRRSAEHRRAFLAGQNSVAMGASSAVNAIEGVLPLLGRPEPGSVMWDVANSWKSTLYQSTVSHGAYLGQIIAEWAADHNRHPDLTSRVEVQTAEGIGTTLLTNEQEPELRERLSRLGLRGKVAVDLEDPTINERPPGGLLRLTVGSHLVEVPADRNRPPRLVDPGPAVFVLGSILMLGDVVGYGVAFLPVVAPIGMGFGGAWWAHLRLRRLGKAAWPTIMWVAIIVALLYTAFATASLLQPLNVAGLESYPVVPGLDLLARLGLADTLFFGQGNATAAEEIYRHLLRPSSQTLDRLAARTTFLYLTTCGLVSVLYERSELDEAEACCRDLVAVDSFTKGERLGATVALSRVLAKRGNNTDAMVLLDRAGHPDAEDLAELRRFRRPLFRAESLDAVVHELGEKRGHVGHSA